MTDDNVLDFDALGAALRQSRMGGGVDDDLRNTILEELPLPYVMMAYSHVAGVPQQDASGEWGCRCPTHNDTSPSLRVMAANPTRAYCHVCARPFNAFNLISQWEGWTANSEYPQAIQRALDLWQAWKLDENRDAYAVAGRSQEEADWPAIQEAFEARRFANEIPIHLFFSERKVAPDAAQWIISEFRLGGREEYNQDLLEVPYFDRDGRLRALKARSLDGKGKLFGPGRVKEVPYGVWRDTGQPVVYVCEGESDTWTVAWHLRQRADTLVVGLPGVGHALNLSDAWVHLLSGRERIVLVLDGDEAGKNATAAMVRRLTGLNVYIVPLPSAPTQKDISQQPNPLEMLDDPLSVSASVAPADYSFDRQGDTLVTFNAENEPIVRAHWWFAPIECVRLENTETLSWRGDVYHNGNVREGVMLTPANLKDNRTLNAWSLENGFGGYTGSASLTAQIANWLTALRPWLSPVRGFNTIGLVDSTFIGPDGVIGPGQSYFYAGPHEFNKIRFAGANDTRFSPEQYGELLTRLFRINTPDVMTPIIAWMAVAPLRSLAKNFPVLGIFGSSGTGKTTTFDQVKRVFNFIGGEYDTNASSASLRDAVGRSNAYPVKIDEYRPSTGSNDTRLADIDNFITSSWDNDAITKLAGNGAGDYREVRCAMSSPMVVVGESEFNSKRVLERSVPVRLTQRTELAATRLLEFESAAQVIDNFGTMYLQWLSEQLQGEAWWMSRIHQIANVSTDDRQQLIRLWLQLGWLLLDEFTEHTNLNATPDWSGLDRTLQETRDADPIAEAVRTSFTRFTSGDTQMIGCFGVNQDGWMLLNADVLLAKLRGTGLPTRKASELIRHLTAVAETMPHNSRSLWLSSSWLAQ